MSKVQVDTIVDKDDISAPTLSKGAIVTGVCTATTFVGAVTGDVTGNATGLTGSPNITVTDVNATGVTTTGIATVTTSVVVGSAVTANSDGVITSGIITASSFAGDGSALTGITQTTINNNANNLLITGSGTANTLEAESQLTYDGTNFQLKKTGSSDYNEIIQDANPSSENGTLGYLSGYWNTTRVADIRFAAGDDTSNKDNAHICFRTTNAGSGSITDRLRIGNLGQIGLPVGGVGVAATDWGSSGQVLTSGGSSAVPTWATPSAGAWTKITSGTIDAVDTIITESLDNTYQLYKLTFYIQLNANGQYIGLRIKTNGSWQTSSYATQFMSGYGDNEISSYAASTDNRMFIPNRSFRCGSGMISFGNVDSTTACKVFRLEFAGNDSLDAPAGANNAVVSQFSSLHDSITAITGIRFFKDGSAPDAGWYVLEGCAIS